jgi:hypothetical protein
MTGGWQAQLDRLRRWYHRASNATDPLDRWDYVNAFFENALHLRDWLDDTGTVPEADLKKFFDANEEMRLCRDLANSHKHYSLNHPSQSTPPSEIREYSPGSGNLHSNASLMILRDGKKYDAFDLAKRILQLWEAFTFDYKIVPIPPSWPQIFKLTQYRISYAHRIMTGAVEKAVDKLRVKRRV